MKKISDKAVVPDNCVIYDDVEIEDGVVLHNFVVLYPGTVLKRGAEVYDHSVIGKLPTSPGSTAKSYGSSFGKTVIGADSIICPGVVIYTGTVIGHNTLIGDNASIREQCVVGDYDIISRNVTINYETKIGSYTKILDGAHITGNMVVGSHVFISVLVTSTNDNSMGRDAEAVSHLQGPVIKDYVTVGAGASLLPGVTVGENAIVGASALVTKDVPPNMVVMGVPARVVKEAASR